MSKLTKKQLKELEAFIFKVSMEGHSYAIQNYPPKDQQLRGLLVNTTVVKSLNNLEKLMELYGFDYS